MNVYDQNDNTIGELRSGIFSPHFKKVIGIVMVKKPFWNFTELCKIEIEGESFNGSLCELPFL
jgi:dimethylsulfoniopropionate demethylase